MIRIAIIVIAASAAAIALMLGWNMYRDAQRQDNYQTGRQSCERLESLGEYDATFRRLARDCWTKLERSR
jgi:hypothetical protein